MKKNDALTVARGNFNNNLSADVFINKYAVKDKDDNYLEFSLDDMSERLANELIKIEKEFNPKRLFKKNNNPSKSDWKKLFNHFLFGGRTLYALGNIYESKASFSNCYVLPISEDSVEGIMITATEMAQTYRAGGGVGVDVTPLRANMMRVNNGAKTTSGAVSFIDLFSKITGVIGQNGRRGALMITLDITHPDIIDFIKLKGGTDIEIAKNCNMSVKITSRFMDEVVNGNFTTEWKTSFTHNNETYEKIFTVGEIWELLIQSSWNRAEPGLLYWDKILEDEPSNLIPDFKAVCTNPCVTGDTWVDTTEGRTQVKDLIGKKFKAIVQHQEYNSISDGFFYTGYKEIIKLKFKSGIELKCTPNHLIQVYNGEYGVYMWCEAKDLMLYGVTKGFSVVLNGKDEYGCILYDDVISIENCGSEDVYDCTIEDVHCFSANGVIVHNCSEISLEPYGACNLGSINLSSFVIDRFVIPMFNFDLFKWVIKHSVRALDLIIDENLKRQPLEKQKVTMKSGRRIGLGFTAYADMLSMMNLTYGSKEALEFTDKIMAVFHKEVLQCDIDLAIEKGAFPKWYKIDSKTKESYVNHKYFWILSDEYKNKLLKHGCRNISFTTVAPNGSLSIIMGNVTSGIEPIFQRGYTRKVITGVGGKEEIFTVYHWLVEEWIKLYDKNEHYANSCILSWYLNLKDTSMYNHKAISWLNENYSFLINATDLNSMLRNDGFTEDEIIHLYELVKSETLNKLFPQSDEIHWKQRVETQAVIQNHISHSISSTVNLPSNIEPQIVSNIFIEAYKMGLKGITVYRDGCRGNILSKIEEVKKPIIIEPRQTVKMNSEYKSKSVVIKSYENMEFDKITDENYNKKWYINFWLDDESNMPVAMFVNTNSKNKEKTLLVQQTIDLLNKIARKYIPISIIEDNNNKIKNESNIDKLARVLSLLLRHHVPITQILQEIETLNAPLGSFVFHIKHALSSFINGVETGDNCPECGERLYHENGCTSCKNCGYSKCS